MINFTRTVPSPVPKAFSAHLSSSVTMPSPPKRPPWPLLFALSSTVPSPDWGRLGPATRNINPKNFDLPLPSEAKRMSLFATIRAHTLLTGQLSRFSKSKPESSPFPKCSPPRANCTLVRGSCPSPSGETKSSICQICPIGVSQSASSGRQSSLTSRCDPSPNFAVTGTFSQQSGYSGQEPESSKLHDWKKASFTTVK